MAQEEQQEKSLEKFIEDFRFDGMDIAQNMRANRLSIPYVLTLSKKRIEQYAQLLSPNNIIQQDRFSNAIHKLKTLGPYECDLDEIIMDETSTPSKKTSNKLNKNTNKSKRTSPRRKAKNTNKKLDIKPHSTPPNTSQNRTKKRRKRQSSDDESDDEQDTNKPIKHPPKKRRKTSTSTKDIKQDIEDMKLDIDDDWKVLRMVYENKSKSFFEHIFESTIYLKHAFRLKITDWRARLDYPRGITQFAVTTKYQRPHEMIGLLFFDPDEDNTLKMTMVADPAKYDIMQQALDETIPKVFKQTQEIVCYVHDQDGDTRDIVENAGFEKVWDKVESFKISDVNPPKVKALKKRTLRGRTTFDVTIEKWSLSRDEYRAKN